MVDILYIPIQYEMYLDRYLIQNTLSKATPTIPYNSSSYKIERDSYTIMPVLLFLKISTFFCLYIMLKYIKSILKRNLL